MGLFGALPARTVLSAGLRDQLIGAIGAAVAKLCEAFPDEGAEIAARIRDLMFDRKKLMDRKQPL